MLEAVPWQETETKQSAEQGTEPIPREHTALKLSWPSPINDKAFYGLAGEFVRSGRTIH